MKRISILGVLMFWCTNTPAQDIIPKPVSLTPGDGTFILGNLTRVNYAAHEIEPLAEYLAGYIPCQGGCRHLTDFQLSFAAPLLGSQTWREFLGAQIILELDPATEIPAEGYRLEVAEYSVRITGKDYGGVWNGIQTFLQLLPAEVYGKPENRPDRTIDVLTIEDYPRFGYRGVMLDVARTFVPKEDVMRFIDNISHHKINKFHWHLADDEGWRIEIKSCPLLTEIGAFRGGDSPVMPVYGAWDRKYGGFYTQDEIREVVAYAALRNVEIIPEIDLPGHSRAAAIACPEILCNYTPDLTASAGYDRRNVWCAAREENYAMLDGILGELAGLFPSGTIHLGGDEVETDQWSQCPDCKALMKEKGITATARLEDVFMERTVEIAAKYDKKAIVWNEAVASGTLDKSVMVSGWEDIAAARKAAAEGYPTVVCVGSYFYFDMRQSRPETGHIWAGIVSPEKVYSFDLAREGFTAAEVQNVCGVEATFFSELLLENGLDFIDYQLFPRVCALGEVAWTPQAERSWSDFERRLEASHFARLAAMGIKYRIPPTAVADATSRPTPAATFTSSLKENAKYPFGGVSSYKTAARTTATCRNGDWFLWMFAEPVKCTRIDIKTGYDHLQRAGIPAGRVEVSYDGKIFEPAGGFRDLKAPVEPDAARGGIRAVRLVSDSEGNGEPFVIIQPLKIYQ